QAFERGEEIAYTARRIRLRRARIAVTSVVLVALGVFGTLLWQRLNRTPEIRIIEKGETRGQAITRIEREARAAYLAGNDAAARTAFGELAQLAKAHPALRWRELLEARTAASKAWAAGDLAAAAGALETVTAEAPEDTIAAGLADRVALLKAARTAVGKRDAAAAREAAQALLATEPGHAEAERIDATAAALSELEQRVAHTDWRGALRAADAATGYGAAPGWTAELLTTVCDRLSNDLTEALAAKDAARARPIAAMLEARTGQAESARTAVAAYERAREAFEREWEAAETHLQAGQGRDALRRFTAAGAIFEDGRLPARLRDAKVWVLRRGAAEAAGRGELERAIALATEAAELAPDDGPITPALERYRGSLADRRAKQAAARLAAGDFAEAGRLAGLALEVVPGHAEAASVASEVDRNTRTPAGFVYIPTTEALLPDGRGGTQRARVTAYYIARTEVTNAQFKAFVDAGGYTDDQWWDGLGAEARASFVDETGKPGPAEWLDGHYPAGTEALPVVGVSWAEASAYARWASARLPSEAEWLAAAGFDPNAGAFHRYPWGDAWEPERVGFGAGGAASLAPVGSRTGDRSNWGCLDMAGNAMEWTAGHWAEGSPHRLILGGSLDPLAARILQPERGCRLDRREARADPVTARLPGLGFRLAKSATEGGH
ncbi:MAG: SUMF1/EgtB/PvdO family nonheme iron enzyme, partial [Planctomycetota bacterium]